MTKSVQRAVLFTIMATVCGALSPRPTFDANVIAQTPTAGGQNPYIADLEKKLAGSENKPAEEVFKNIQILKGAPALRVLRIMTTGFSASLGVDCAHCHVPGDWEKEDKPQKETARKMWRLMNKLNQDLKETIGKGGVNCTTCHRGQIKPALSLTPTK
jgi:Photosynthetic reaction centre cytochrome C subunit